MRPLTPQQIADAAAKRAASVAARKATGGMTVRQQRAAAKGAKANQPYTPPAPKAARAPRPRFNRRARHGARPVPPVQSGPVFSTPAPNTRALKLAGLVALEAAFIQKTAESGATPELRAAFAQYKKVKALALGAVANSSMQNEADTALRLAVVALVKLTY